MKIRSLFCALLFLISCRSVAQNYGELIIYQEISVGSSGYIIDIFRDSSTVSVMTRTNECQEEIQLDSIEAGRYRLVIKEKGSNHLYFSRDINVLPNDITRITVNINISEERDYSDTTKYYGRTGDGELNFGYQNGKLESANSVFRQGFMIGMGAHYWKVKRPHFATTFGFGFNYHYNKISGDTSFIAAPESYKKTEECYHYLDGHLDFKLRLCGANQQIPHVTHNFILEVGALYNFPLYFRYRGNYEGNKMIQAWGIHQFKDFRAFVNFGYYPFLFFYEYRLTDFVIGKYPELPRSTFGVRILMVTLAN